MNKIAYILFLVFCLNSCRQNNPAPPKGTKKYQPRYASFFSISYTQQGKFIYVKNTENEVVSTYFVGDEKQAQPTVNIPEKNSRIVCLSTTHIAALALLDATDKIVAIANEDRCSNQTVKEKLRQNNVALLGSDFSPNLEKLIGSRPTFVFSDGESENASLLFNKLKSLNIPMVYSKDYFEQSPLARAEWIVFFAAFINEEKKAIAYFDAIEKNYLALKNTVKKDTNRPTVFCNLPYQQIWYMPCKNNYVTTLITDAGGDFLWKDVPPANGLNLQLSFEEVYAKAKDATIWLNVNMAQTLRQVQAEDERYTRFSAFKNKHIFSPKVVDGYAMPIWEYGIFEPDKILADLIAVFSQTDTANFDKLNYYHRLQ